LEKVKYLNNSNFQNFGKCAFKNCYNLENLEIPKNIKQLPSRVFENCYKLSSIEIPSDTTTIDEYAFSHCTSLQKVTLKNELMTVNDYAFFHCQKLDSITSENIITLGTSAFEYCISLANFNVKNLSQIPTSCFAFCFNLNDIKFNSSNIYQIHDKAFQHTKISTLPSNFSYIGEYAFYNTSFTELKIPNVAAIINGNAFSSCSELKNVIFENDLYSTLEMKSFLFSNCKNLQTVKYAKSFTSIPSYMFYNDYSLTDITDIDSVESIEEYAFSGCSKINFEFNHNMQLSSYSFQNCSGSTFTNIDYLSTIPIFAFAFSRVPQTITFTGTPINIQNYSFFYSTGIKTLNINGLFQIYSNSFAMSSLESIYFTIYYNSEIYDQAFSNCESLTKVSLDPKITNNCLEIEIYDHAFENCIKLSEFDFSKADFILGDYVFNNTQLKSIKLSKTQSEFNPLAFDGAKVEEISVDSGNLIYVIKEKTLHKTFDLLDYFIYYPPYLKDTSYKLETSTNSIGKYAFYGCKYLKTLSNPKDGHIYELEDYAFSESSITSLELNGFMANTEILTSYFYCMTNLQKLTINSNGNFSFTSIHNKAFYNCYSLQDLNFDCQYIDSISPYAFYNCLNLKELSFPHAQTIGERAFENCYSLTKLSLPLASTFEYEFLGSSGIKEFKFEKPIESIPSYAFFNCSKLTTVTLLEGLREISDNAFGKCTSLKSITLPNSLETIEENAFYYCKALKEINIPQHVESIGKLAFSKTKLTLKIDPNNGKYSMYNNALIEDGNILHSLVGNVKSSYVVPYFISTINPGFNNYEIVTYLSLPETFTFSSKYQQETIFEYEENEDASNIMEATSSLLKSRPITICYSRKNITYSQMYQEEDFINNLLLPQAYRFLDWENVKTNQYITFKEVSSCPSTYSTDTLYDELKAVFEEDGKTFSQTQIYIGAGIFILIFILLIVFIILFIIQKRSSKSNIEDSDNSVVRAPII